MIVTKIVPVPEGTKIFATTPFIKDGAVHTRVLMIESDNEIVVANQILTASDTEDSFRLTKSESFPKEAIRKAYRLFLGRGKELQEK